MIKLRTGLFITFVAATSTSQGSSDFMSRLQAELDMQQSETVSAYSDNWGDLRQAASQFTPPATSPTKALFGRDPKLAPELQALARTLDNKSLFEVDEQAKRLGISLQQQQVPVVLTARSARERKALARRVEALGGYVTAGEDDLLYADLPLDAINAITHLEEMDYARPQRLEQPYSLNSSGKVISEGVGLTRAQRFHNAGFTGKGVKVGILDFGFRYYQELQTRGELPEPVAMKTFGSPDPNELHGTACAEIIHDMAPNAQLYIAAFDGRADNWVQGAQWLLSQGVDLISYSGGSHWSSHDAIVASHVLSTAWCVSMGCSGWWRQATRAKPIG